MNKRILRSISIILVIVFLVSAPVYAFAAEARASAWFTGYGASVVASGNGKINVEFTVVGTGTMTKLGGQLNLHIQVRRYAYSHNIIRHQGQ